MTENANSSDHRVELLESIAKIQADPLFVLDAEGNYLDCLGGNDRTLYDDPSFLVGKNIRDILPAELVEMIQEAVGRALDRRGLVVVEYQLGNAQVEGSSRNGPSESQWFEGRIMPLDQENDGVPCVAWLAINISARKQAERALLESEARLRELTEMLLTAERLARVKSWEWDIAADRWTTMGSSREVRDLVPSWMTSEGLKKNIHPDDLPVFQAALEEALENGTAETQYRVIAPQTGETRHVRSYGTVIRNQTGTPVKLRGAVQDITEQHRAEAQIRRAENMRMTGQLAGGFAHEFNNLLQIMIGSVDMARQYSGGDAKLSRLFDAATTAVHRGRELTQYLLSFSRRQDLVPTVIDPAELIQGTVEMLAPVLGEMIRLELTLADDLPLIRVDRSGFETALLNIALNAVAAMPRGGSLTLQAQSIDISGKEAGAEPIPPGRYLEIVLTDTGHGMSEDVLARVFEPFFTTREVGEGTGLGLSMVQGFVHQSNGSVTMDSREGKGTTVRVLLPATDEKGARLNGMPRSSEISKMVGATGFEPATSTSRRG